MAVIGEGCAECPKTPEAPESGTYEVTNPEELPMTVTSVVIEDQQLTIRYLDDAGVEQYVVYDIRR